MGGGDSPVQQIIINLIPQRITSLLTALIMGDANPMLAKKDNASGIFHQHEIIFSVK